MSFEFFITEFFKKATEKTSKIFYQAVYGKNINYSVTLALPRQEYSLKDFENYKVKLMDVLISSEELEVRKILLAHFKVLYETFESLDFHSKKTIRPDLYYENDNTDLDDYNRLPPKEYNKVLSKIINIYNNSGMYLRYQNMSSNNCFKGEVLVETYDDKMKNFSSKVYEIVAVDNTYRINNGKKSCVFNIEESEKVTFFIEPSSNNSYAKKHRAISLKLTYYEIMIKKINRIKDKPCVWCNPITSSHKKCDNCKILYKNYENLRLTLEERLKNVKPLPKDLTQVIRRARKSAVDLNNITDVRNVIKEKIITVIDNPRYKNVSFTQKEIDLKDSFLNLLNNSF